MDDAVALRQELLRCGATNPLAASGDRDGESSVGRGEDSEQKKQRDDDPQHAGAVLVLVLVVSRGAPFVSPPPATLVLMLG